MSRNDFYVYLHKKSTTGEIFYVGKGRGARAYDKKMRNRHWHFIVAKHGFVVEFVEVGLQEWAAFEIESQFIALYGRMDLNNGKLVNYTDGGDGSSGFVMPNETKIKISKTLTGRKMSASAIKKLSERQIGVEKSAETKNRISISLSGRKMDEDVKTKIRITSKKNAKRSSSHYKAVGVHCITTGESYGSVADAAKWLVSIGHKKACHTNILHVCNGRHSNCYGYSWKYSQ